LTAPTAGANRTARAPPSRATSSTSFWSAQGSLITTRISSALICRMRRATWAGNGGIPGRSSIVAASASPNRSRKYNQVS
jgi:hypothetical protein